MFVCLFVCLFVCFFVCFCLLFLIFFVVCLGGVLCVSGVCVSLHENISNSDITSMDRFILKLFQFKRNNI